MKINSLSFFFILFFLINVSFSQDIHFSQYYTSPLTLNPSLTCNFDGKWRLMNIYRRQWDAFSIPYITASIGFDHAFNYRNDKITAGILLLNDKSGGAQLNVTKLYLSGAYIMNLNDHHFSFGIQTGLNLKSFSNADITFPDQYDNNAGVFDKELPTQGPSSGDNLNFLDMNAGLSWRKRMGRIEPCIGFAMYHLQQPKESFFKNHSTLPRRQVVHAGSAISLGSKIYIYPNILFMSHTKANDLLAGSNIGYIFYNNYGITRSIFTGFLFRTGYNRNPDAAIAIAGISFHKWDIGVSYDFNISDLKTVTNHKGGFEFSLIYKGIAYQLTKISLPCDIH